MGRYYKKRYYRKNDNDGIAYLILFGLFMLISFIQKYWHIILILVLLTIIYFIIRHIIDLDLNSDLKKPIIYHLGTHGQKWLEEIKNNNLENTIKIKSIESGIWGEKNLLHSLEYSNIPMYIMYDLKLECNGYKSQIDVVAITKRNIYFLESKNLKDNLDVESNGNFTRKIGKYKKGIKNPLTQNSEHELVINAIFEQENIKEKYESWVVLTNDNSYINYKKGTENIQSKIMRNDKLIENMKKLENSKHLKMKEERIKEICDCILKYDISQIKTDEEIINELKEYRKQRMILENVDAYIIFKDETIYDLVEKRPINLEQLINIKGLGEVKIKKYGNDIINIINENRKNM